MWFFKGSRRERYTRGFKWGKREHRAEELATKVLTLCVVILGLHLWSENIYLAYFAMAFLVAALVLRLVAAFAHKREKHYMDELRFKRSK